MNSHGPLRIACRVDPTFGENGYVLWTSGGSEAWIVDPGFPPQPDELRDVLNEHELRPVAIVLTHCHLDHIAGVRPLRGAYPDIQIIAPRAEDHMLNDPVANLSAPIGLSITAPAADRLLDPGEELALGELRWRVLDVSGHSPGGLAFYCAAAGVVISGDSLFAGGIGRVDFPGSSGRRLLQNIRAQLLTLPNESVVYSGHGLETTIGDERRQNPFLRASSPLLTELEF